MIDGNTRTIGIALMILPLEACIECNDTSAVYQSVCNAVRGGARRIELCRNMAEQGLTPDAALIRVARQVFGARDGLLAMIRPRAGNFCYNCREIQQMCEQIAMAAQAGADGVVLGLADNGRINEKLLDTLLQTAQDCQLSVTFHRAFDLLTDRARAIDLLIDKKVQRVLTSGMRDHSLMDSAKALDNIRDTLQRAEGFIEVVICGGIDSDNVTTLLSNVLLQDTPAANVNTQSTLLSIHCHSGLLHDGITDFQRVDTTVKAIKRFINTAAGVSR